MLVEFENQNDVCVLRLKGRFAASKDLDYLLSMTVEIQNRKCSKLLVDLSEVAAIGSTVIAFIVDLYSSTTKQADGRFILAGANSRIREVLDLTRLSTLIPLAEDIESGLAGLRGKDPAVLTASK
jgi:anti-anti-sigma factor